MNTANPAELSREDVERIQAIIRRFISSPDHESMWFNPEDTKIVIHALRATMRYLTIRDGTRIMNPVELSREDVERILALAAKCPVAPTDPIADGWYEEHDLLGTHKIALRCDAQLIAASEPDALIRLCQMALRYLNLRDSTRIVCTLDGVHLSGAALDQECDK